MDKSKLPKMDPGKVVPSFWDKWKPSARKRKPRKTDAGAMDDAGSARMNKRTKKTNKAIDDIFKY